MHRSPDDGPPGVPPEWLPEPSPAEGTPEWEGLATRVLAAAELELAPGAAAHIAPATELTWTAVLGSWWRPATLLAAAATVLLILVRPDARPPVAAGPGDVSLAVLAGRGNPAGVFESLGIPVDPVLALIAARGGQP